MDHEKDETTPQEPETEPEEGTEEEPAAGEGQDGGEADVKDSHGQPGINREKYQRDIEAKDKQIAELQAQLDERSKTEEGRAALAEELDKLKADMADERTDHKLQLAGCLNAKAAKWQETAAAGRTRREACRRPLRGARAPVSAAHCRTPCMPCSNLFPAGQQTWVRPDIEQAACKGGLLALLSLRMPRTSSLRRSAIRSHDHRSRPRSSASSCSDR